MEERLDDAIHVLRNHAEPVLDGRMPPTSRLSHPHSIGNDAPAFGHGMGVAAVRRCYVLCVNCVMRYFMIVPVDSVKYVVSLFVLRRTFVGMTPVVMNFRNMIQN